MNLTPDDWAPQTRQTRARRSCAADAATLAALAAGRAQCADSSASEEEHADASEDFRSDPTSEGAASDTSSDADYALDHPQRSVRNNRLDAPYVRRGGRKQVRARDSPLLVRRACRCCKSIAPRYAAFLRNLRCLRCMSEFPTHCAAYEIIDSRECCCCTLAHFAISSR